MGRRHCGGACYIPKQFLRAPTTDLDANTYDEAKPNPNVDTKPNTYEKQPLPLWVHHSPTWVRHQGQHLIQHR